MEGTQDLDRGMKNETVKKQKLLFHPNFLNVV